jgi:hypothetical protein
LEELPPIEKVDLGEPIQEEITEVTQGKPAENQEGES